MLGEEYTYPEWSTAVGWILTMSSIMCIPTYICYKFIRTPGGFLHVKKSHFSPMNFNLKYLFYLQRIRTIFKPEQSNTTAIPGQIIGGSGTAV